MKLVKFLVWLLTAACLSCEESAPEGALSILFQDKSGLKAGHEVFLQDYPSVLRDQPSPGRVISVTSQTNGSEIVCISFPKKIDICKNYIIITNDDIGRKHLDVYQGSLLEGLVDPQQMLVGTMVNGRSRLVDWRVPDLTYSYRRMFGTPILLKKEERGVVVLPVPSLKVVDWKSAMAFEDYLTRALPTVVKDVFPIEKHRVRTFVLTFKANKAKASCAGEHVAERLACLEDVSQIFPLYKIEDAVYVILTGRIWLHVKKEVPSSLKEGILKQYGLHEAGVNSNIFEVKKRDVSLFEFLKKLEYENRDSFSLPPAPEFILIPTVFDFD